MTVLAILAVVAFVTWVYLLLGHGRFWRTDLRLPVAARDPDTWPDVVAVVPARDEAELLPRTLPTLLAQDYPGMLRVVLVDDGSTDGTAEVARGLARGATVGVTVVQAGTPPEGWAGKVAALATGVGAAGSCSYLLFTDADIAHGPTVVADLVAAAVADDRDLVSRMALLRTGSGWERLLVPAFVYFFAQLYPFRRVNRPGTRTAAAAGGCVLLRRAALESAGGLDRIKGALIDDVALGRLIKAAVVPRRDDRGTRRGRVWLGLTVDTASVRPYRTLASLWTMVTRSAYTQLRRSPTLVVGTVLGLLLVYLVPPVAGVVGALGWSTNGGSAATLVATAAGLTGWGIMTATYAPMTGLYGLPVWRTVTLPPAAALYVAMTVDSARRGRRGWPVGWKGR